VVTYTDILGNSDTGAAKRVCVCQLCGGKVGVTRFAMHLDTCTRRGSRRRARAVPAQPVRKIAAKETPSAEAPASIRPKSSYGSLSDAKKVSTFQQEEKQRHREGICNEGHHAVADHRVVAQRPLSSSIKQVAASNGVATMASKKAPQPVGVKGSEGKPADSNSSRKATPSSSKSSRSLTFSAKKNIKNNKSIASKTSKAAAVDPEHNVGTAKNGTAKNGTVLQTDSTKRKIQAAPAVKIPPLNATADVQTEGVVPAALKQASPIAGTAKPNQKRQRTALPSVHPVLGCMLCGHAGNEVSMCDGCDRGFHIGCMGKSRNLFAGSDSEWSLFLRTQPSHNRSPWFCIFCAPLIAATWHGQVDSSEYGLSIESKVSLGRWFRGGVSATWPIYMCKLCQRGITGERWRCLVCHNVDICGPCQVLMARRMPGMQTSGQVSPAAIAVPGQSWVHDMTHRMVKFWPAGARSPPRPPLH